MTATEVIGNNLWLSQASPALPTATATGTVDADVAIVGAGPLGAAAAYYLARQGHSVALIDDGCSEASAASASGGILAPQLVRNTPRDVVRRLGRDRGEALLRLYGSAGERIFGLIEEAGIDCDASNAGFLAPFAAPAQAEMARRAVNEWQPLRRDVKLIGASEAAALSGCIGYAGAVLDESGGALDPVRYRRGLIMAAIRQGAQFVADRVIEPLGKTPDGHHRLRCAGGEVRARRVILAANGGNAALHRKLRRTTLPLPVCEVATAPVPEHIRREILPQGHSLTDLQVDIFTIRFDRSGRLITACPVPDKLDHQRLEQDINRRLADMLPAWQFQPLQHAWVGTAWLTTNFLPRFVQCEDGVMAIQACNGRGLAMSATIGLEAARWASAAGTETAVPMTRPQPIRGYLIARYVPRLLMMLAALRRAPGNNS